jgi:hypothetical protein
VRCGERAGVAPRPLPLQPLLGSSHVAAPLASALLLLGSPEAAGCSTASI